MFAVDVCELPATGRSSFVVVAALVVLVVGVVMARWARRDAGRLSIFIAPLLIAGGLGVVPRSVDCFDPGTTPPGIDVIRFLPDATTALVSNPSLNPGDQLTVSISGFQSNAVVQLVIASNPQVIAWTTADSQGVGSLTGLVPSNLDAGDHTLAVFSPTSGEGMKQSVTVGVPSSAAATSSTSTSSSTSTTAAPSSTTTTSTSTTSTTTTTTSSTTAAPSSPALYQVGDPGPAGGVIFYVDVTAPAGQQYWEAACVGWSNSCDGTTPDPLASWGCMGQVIAGAAGENIGTGEQNTASIVTDCATTGTAAELASSLVLGGQSDWFLPSKFESNELCKYARNTGQAAGSATQCAGGTLRSGFQVNRYWTSTEYDVTRGWFKNFDNGNYNINDKSYALYSVRPIRSF